MKSTIILYERCDIEKEKLFIVDSLSTYLAGLSKVTISDFQYIRQDLLTSIKLNMNQTSINPDSLNNYNYLSIQNGTEKVFYYFIDKKTQVAKDTILFTLSLDTINTFKLNVDFYITDKTILNRMHKDRFAVISSTLMNKEIVITGEDTTARISAILSRVTYIYTLEEYFGYAVDNIEIDINNNNVGLVSYNILGGYLSMTFQSADPESFSFIAKVSLTASDRLVRKIDKISEGVSPILYGRELGKLTEESFKENSYLVYKGSKAIKCLLTFDQFHTAISGGKSVLSATDFTTNTYYYFMVDTLGRPNADFYRIENGNDILVYSVEMETDYRHCVVLRSDGSDIFLGYIIYRETATGWRIYDSLQPENVGPQIKIQSNANPLRAFLGGSWTTLEEEIYALPQNNIPISVATREVYPITSLDRTDETLVKIIKLPYSIVDLDDVDNTWDYDATDHMLQYKNLDKKLVREIVVHITQVPNPLTNLNYIGTPLVTALKSMNNESKLLHSDYYQPKFVYDSFSKVFALERIDLSSYELFSGSPFIFNFMASNTITSKFLFQFPQYKTSGYMMEDFDNILPVDRNNEMTIYSSDYLAYIKTGFNYDIKKKNREAVVGGLSTGLAIVGAVASFALGSNPFTAAAGISLGVTAMTKLINTVNTTVQAEASIQQKLNQLDHQKDSVYNTDAVDLLDYYCDNKAKMMLYEVGENVKKAMFDLFFYTGYLCGYRGIPDFSSRIRFNFVSCDLDFDMGKTGSKYINKDILDDIYNKFSAGVTNIHHYNSEWDFEQKYENWETFLFS